MDLVGAMEEHPQVIGVLFLMLTVWKVEGYGGHHTSMAIFQTFLVTGYPMDIPPGCIHGTPTPLSNHLAAHCVMAFHLVSCFVTEVVLP